MVLHGFGFYALMLFVFLATQGVAQQFPTLKKMLDQTADVHAVTFLDPECPISQKYTKTLNDLAERHGARVKFYGFIPVQGISEQEISNFREYYQIRFHCVRDVKLQVAKNLKATVTPEVFLLDNNLNVVYSGAIDDWYFDFGKARAQPTQHFLADAIEKHLSSKPITVLKTAPVGCSIGYRPYVEKP